MATHDPLVFAGLRRHEVRIMQRDSVTRKIVAVPPDEDPRGMGVEAILTSELFGLRAALDSPTLDDLDEKRNLEALEGTHRPGSPAKRADGQAVRFGLYQVFARPSVPSFRRDDDCERHKKDCWSQRSRRSSRRNSGNSRLRQ